MILGQLRTGARSTTYAALIGCFYLDGVDDENDARGDHDDQDVDKLGKS